jgi:hypothetical protein
LESTPPVSPDADRTILVRLKLNGTLLIGRYLDRPILVCRHLDRKVMERPQLELTAK